MRHPASCSIIFGALIQAALTHIAIGPVWCNQGHRLHHMFIQEYKSGRDERERYLREPQQTHKSRLQIETSLRDSPDVTLR